MKEQLAILCLSLLVAVNGSAPLPARPIVKHGERSEGIIPALLNSPRFSMTPSYEIFKFCTCRAVVDQGYCFVHPHTPPSGGTAAPSDWALLMKCLSF